MVVDEDVDVQNFSEVAWKALNNIDPERDIQFVMGPVDSLDHASAAGELRQQDGRGRDEEVAGRGLHAAVAGCDHDGSGCEGEGGCDVEEGGTVGLGVAHRDRSPIADFRPTPSGA